jgi:mannose-6-phosphate isomerase-like protein (cupin superfamily)
VEPGTANDLDVHRSREVWIVIDGNAKAVWGDGHAMELAPGDVVAFESLTPHQLVNDGPISFVAASVFWIDQNRHEDIGLLADGGANPSVAPGR